MHPPSGEGSGQWWLQVSSLFHPSHRPQTSWFKGRDDQLRSVQKAVARGNGALFLHGPPGTGKTALAEAVAADLEGWNVGHVTCTTVSTADDFCALVHDFLQYGDTSTRASPDGKCTPRANLKPNAVKWMLERKCWRTAHQATRQDAKRRYLLVLDEVDAFVSKRQLRSWLELLVDGCQQPSSRLLIMAISNHPKLNLDLESNVLSQVRAEDRIYFPEYSVEQFVEIVDARLKSGGVSSESVFKGSAAKLLARKAVLASESLRGGGDARLLLSCFAEFVDKRLKRSAEASPACENDSQEPPAKRQRTVEPASMTDVQAALPNVGGTELPTWLQSIGQEERLFVTAVILGRVAARRQSRKDVTVSEVMQTALLLSERYLRDYVTFGLRPGQRKTSAVQSGVAKRVILRCCMTRDLLMLDGRPAGQVLKSRGKKPVSEYFVNVMHPSSRSPVTPRQLHSAYVALSRTSCQPSTALDEVASLAEAVLKHAVKLCPDDDL
eukprot:TRINITY_DN44393_c0_g1_i1.p1 TRINITY_DN44393_c0_g1~~TRINITY_DN44393_c0_g1_i1.p1  ORF type:complete len:515 (+),score=146.79 TRINITY_DN44393_c0_g1_i1:58-1545(+)